MHAQRKNPARRNRSDVKLHQQPRPVSPNALDQTPAVRSEARNDEPHVVVHAEALLLVRRELRGRALERSNYNVRGRRDAHAHSALLHRLHRVLDLEQAALGAPGRHVRIVLQVVGGKKE